MESRSHTEKVVDYLQYNVLYSKKAKYWVYDAYKKAPFLIELDKINDQLINVPFIITPIDDEKCQLSITVPKSGMVQNSINKKLKRVQLQAKKIEREIRYDELIDLGFLKFTLKRYINDRRSFNNEPVTVRLIDFNSAVARNRSILVKNEKANSPVIDLTMVGANEHRLVDYLNASLEVLSKDQLDRKNLFATRTIEFVDNMLDSLKTRVSSNEKELNNFKQNSKSLDLNAEGAKISEELATLDAEKDGLQKKYAYLDELENYLNSKTDYSEVPVPSIVGIEEANIVSNVGKIISMSEERTKLSYAIREDSPVFKEKDRNIGSLKVILLKNIASYRSALSIELNALNSRLSRKKAAFSKLPLSQQKLINIERKYKLSNKLYDLFLNKRSEANLIKAANVSDLIVIDRATSLDISRVGPNKDLNYIIAIIVGLLLPTLLIVLLFLLNNKITGQLKM